MTDLTLYQLMAEDMTIWVKLVDKNHVNIEIQDELDVAVYNETSHIAAWESLVYFAKQIISVDERIQVELEDME